MNDQQIAFAHYYVDDPDLNQTAAYVRAYPESSENSARSGGSRLMANANVRALIRDLMAKRGERLQISQDDVLNLIYDTATANPNELVQVRRFACRYCYGDAHLYQYTQGEYLAALAKWRTAVRTARACRIEEPPEPDVCGGIGYTKLLPPYPSCPECHGDGEEDVILMDTRTLSPAALRLYAGAERTKSGIKVHTHNRDKNVEMLARHLGMLTDRVDLTSAGAAFKPMSLAEFYGVDDGAET